MKWFKHPTDSLNSEKVAELIQIHGYEGYGHYWRIMELVAERMDETDRCWIELPEEDLRRILKVSRKKLKSFLEVFGKLFGNFSETSQKLFGKTTIKIKIEIPNLLKIRDNYTKNLQATNKSLPSKEVEVEEEEEEEEDIKPLSCPESRKPDSARGEAKGFKFENEDLEFSEYMFSKVSEFVPSMTKGKNKLPDLRLWANVVRLMREQDGHSISEIRDMYDWILSQPASNGGFSWKANIRSPGKLREKWLDLEARRTCGTGPPVPSKLNGNRQSHKPAFRL